MILNICPHIEPVAIVDNNDRPALPLELALALLHRLGRSVWGGHKVRAVGVLQQIFVKYLCATNICQISFRNKYLSNIFIFFIFMHFKILPEQCPRRTPGNNFKIKISSFFICSHLCFVTAHRMNLIGDHLDQMSKLHL